MPTLKTFGPMVPMPFAPNFTADEYAIIIEGFKPKMMEDKWVIEFQAPNLNFYRSWTGMGVYQLKLEQRADRFVVTEAMVDQEIAEEQTATYAAAIADFLVSNLLLNKNASFPKPAELEGDHSGLLQHHLAGSGFPEVIHREETTTKPWWKFW